MNNVILDERVNESPLILTNHPPLRWQPCPSVILSFFLFDAAEDSLSLSHPTKRAEEMKEHEEQLASLHTLAQLFRVSTATIQDGGNVVIPFVSFASTSSRRIDFSSPIPCVCARV